MSDDAPCPNDSLPLQSKLARALRRARELQPVSVGSTPARDLSHPGTATLYRYGSGKGIPLLVIYSLVNRPYILDLSCERSVIGALVRGGITVYLLDWGYPGPMDRFQRLDDYIEDEIDCAVDNIATRHATDRVSLLGVCQGGTLAVCYAALRAERVRNLITLATPVDFQTPQDTLYRIVRHVNIERLAQAQGNAPASGLNALFTGLKPFQLLCRRYLTLAELGADDQALQEFLRLEQWMYDSPDQAGAAFVQFVRDFYQANGLVAGNLQLCGESVDPIRFTGPLFNAYATADHLVPPAAAKALANLTGSLAYREAELPGGHLGLFISQHAHRRLYPALVEWLHQYS
ncbi:MAG: alpha/beta fold hydrolase [Nitrococcus mobilis]|nr:alpha/beta fold hydrolase [Nitrococcus mobilis]